MTLIVLRTGFSLLEVAFFFGIPKATCSRTFQVWLQILAAFLEVISPTPSKEVLIEIEKRFPSSKSFKVSHIIDTSAVNIQTPSMLSRQSATYSKYYSANCAKYLVCLSAGGYISYVSRAYPGRITDTQICNHGFFEFLKQSYPQARVLADKGFFIHFALAKEGAILILPSHEPSSEKFSEDQIVHTKTVANERIFIEHVVGAMKSEFKILSKKISLKQVDQIDLILKITCGLLNLVHSPFIPQKTKALFDSSIPCAHELIHNPDFLRDDERLTTSSSSAH